MTHQCQLVDQLWSLCTIVYYSRQRDTLNL